MLTITHKAVDFSLQINFKQFAVSRWWKKYMMSLNVNRSIYWIVKFLKANKWFCYVACVPQTTYNDHYPLSCIIISYITITLFIVNWNLLLSCLMKIKYIHSYNQLMLFNLDIGISTYPPELRPFFQYIYHNRLRR